jgi:hypothetical protein
MHGIKVLMAKNYIDNLSEEARKGQQEKAEQGIWPTKTPLGYRNITGADGKKVIAVDPSVALIVSRLFEWYATGQYALKEVAMKARAAGLVYLKSGNPVPTSTVHSILRNRLYTGWFEWNGKLYQGRHEPLVSLELWERVQGVSRRTPQPRSGRLGGPRSTGVRARTRWPRHQRCLQRRSDRRRTGQHRRGVSVEVAPRVEVDDVVAVIGHAGRLQQRCDQAHMRHSW